MLRSRLILIPTSARLLLIGLLFAISSIPLGAQAVLESHTGQGFAPSYDAAHEITLTGAIQEVVAQHVAGSPAGMHLLVAGAQGLVDTHVGPFLSKETIAALQTGTPIQIVGATLSLHGRDYFLARQLIIGGRTVTVRSERGFLVHEHSPRVARSRPEGKSNETTQKGSEL